MPASIKQRILSGTRAYLAGCHADDPVLHPAEVKAIARHVGVSRGTFYNWLKKNDPEMGDLFREIEDANDRASRRGCAALALSAEERSACGVASAELERELREGLERVVWTMRGFLSLMENSAGVSEAPLLMAELDAKLKTCRAIYLALEGPYEEWARRQRAEPAMPPPDGSDEQERLDLDGTGEE